MALRTGSPTRKKSIANVRAERAKIDKYNIEVDTMVFLPAELCTTAECRRVRLTCRASVAQCGADSGAVARSFN